MRQEERGALAKTSLFDGKFVLTHEAHGKNSQIEAKKLISKWHQDETG